MKYSDQQCVQKIYDNAVNQLKEILDREEMYIEDTLSPTARVKPTELPLMSFSGKIDMEN